MLFAETVTNSEVGVIVLTVVNSLGAAFTFWVKTRYDARFAAVEDDLKDCQSKHAEAEGQQAENSQKIAALEASRDAERTAKDAERTAKLAAVSQKAMVAYRLAFIEAWLQRLHPELKIPVYVAPDDTTADHEPLAQKDG